MPGTQAHHAAQDAFRPGTAEAAACLRGDEQGVRPRHLLRQTIGLSQIAGAQFLHVYKPRNWINCGQAGPLGWTLPAALGVRAADPDRTIVALSGDYDFQFMIEELAVGAQHKLPYLHVVVNNSYLGLIRQAQRGFEHGFRGAASPSRTSTRRAMRKGYGVDHVAVAEGWAARRSGSRARNEFQEAFEQASVADGRAFQVPVVVEFILERVTNIAMGTDIDKVNEFEELAERSEDAPTAIMAARLRRNEDFHAKLAANLTMLFNEVPFLDRFALAARPASRQWNISFPMISTPSDCPAPEGQRLDPGAAQPAGRSTGPRASAASPSCPTAPTSSS
jgi:TPP-dependent pyruvate/acetoin dehydrogenase alpha subunit